ncbi:MAG: hypothetical protein MK086_06865 [Flavobacteriales bacterium]|nr:hypothetical protein [Flavobacteriales bacterium]
MLFQEKQKFTQPLLWLVLFMLVCIPVIGLFKQVYLGEAFGTNPMSNSGLVVFSICMIALALIFVLIELRTTIDNNGISFQFFPFVKNSHSWSVIASAEVINYGFVGGWGVRWVNKYGTVYSVSGIKGCKSSSRMERVS